MSKGRPRKQYELYIDGEYKASGNSDELSELLKMKPNLLYKRVNKEIYGILLRPIDEREEIYAFYNGEDGPYIGTIPELVEQTGITERMLKWYSYPSSQERSDISLFKLEDDEMRVRRTNDKYAPIMTDEKYDPAKKEKLIISKPVEPAEFKVGRYAQSLHDSYFKGWNLKGEV